MTDAKAAVRAALSELIEADGKFTPFNESIVYPGDAVGHCPKCKGTGCTENGFKDCQACGGDGKTIYRCDLVLAYKLYRNLAPRMARILLKMLDETDCLMCGGLGYRGWSASAKTAMQDIPCPRCTARWQEWAEILGVK